MTRWDDLVESQTVRQAQYLLDATPDPGERSTLAERIWSLAKRNHQDRLRRLALRAYRDARRASR